MISRLPQGFRLTATLGLALVVVAAQASLVKAQHTPDPYNIVGEYNSQYEPYMYANQPNDSSLVPNQSRFDERAGYRNANRFQSYINEARDEEDDDLFGRMNSKRRSTSGKPYYQAYRRFDEQFGRSYRPNENADSSYNESRTELNRKYFEAMREKDPRKKAQMLREFNLENLRLSRSLTTSRGSTRREPKRESERDRFAPRDLTESMEPDEDETPAQPLPSRRGTTGAGATRSLLPPLGGSSTRSTAPRPSGSSTGSLPFGAGFGRGPGSAPAARGAGSASSVLERGELLERARRSVRSRSTAPPPPDSSR